MQYGGPHYDGLIFLKARFYWRIAKSNELSSRTKREGVNVIATAAADPSHGKSNKMTTFIQMCCVGECETVSPMIQNE